MRKNGCSLIVTWSVVVAAVGLAPAPAARADEGMWLVTTPPLQALRDKYHFEPSPAWLEHVQKSAASMGASGSLVSADGLLMTNHHVGVDQVFKLSTPERDLLKEGFYARTREEELKCPDMEVKILWSVQDVTKEINAAVGADMNPAAAYEARRKAMTKIEQTSKDETKLDSEVVTLWHGARYHLYRYRKYNDVRLVMAPEKAIAFFGGDTDNFEFPRFDLDCCFFRVYENGKPIKPEHHLKWSRKGASDGELMFVLGHPGRTRRLLTVDHLTFLRDVWMPTKLQLLWRRESQLKSFVDRGPENARIGEDDFFGVQNGRKAYTGGYATILDPSFMARKQKEETALRGSAKSAEPWEQIATAEKTYREFFARHNVLRDGAPFWSRLLGIARTVYRLADELPKASPERLREYRDSELDSVYFDLYSPAPIYDALEIETIASGLSYAAEQLGGDDPLVRKLLDGLPPRERARKIVEGTKLKDIATRRKLVEGGKKAIEASEDPALKLVALLDPETRALRKRFEDEVEGVEREHYARIAAVQFDRYGESVYPDATGTLRFAFGAVKGYEEDGRAVPPFTTIAGLYERWEQRGPGAPFELPRRWIEARERLNLKTPLNFVLTADIIGGNSGSPVVNAAGEVTGLIFDGNLQSLAWDFMFDDRQGRAMAVDAQAIIEALRVVYHADALADELLRD